MDRNRVALLHLLCLLAYMAQQGQAELLASTSQHQQQQQQLPAACARAATAGLAALAAAKGFGAAGELYTYDPSLAPPADAGDDAPDGLGYRRRLRRRLLRQLLRRALRQVRYRKVSSWGPRTDRFPAWQPPAGCDAAGTARARVAGAVQALVPYGFCYCHHHALWWMPPPGTKDTCNPACVGTRAMPKQGADCSNYSAYLYNMALGMRFSSGIGAQACKPGSAPGKLLPYTTQQQDAFQPGDLLFITVAADAPPARVSHVIVWTGLTADFSSSGNPLSWDTLLANLAPAQQASAVTYAQARRAAGQPVYVITDSHYTGPNYRPFAGWYVNSFSHARRVVLGPAGAGLPDNDPSVAYFDGESCVSAWALNGRGGGGGGVSGLYGAQTVPSVAGR